MKLTKEKVKRDCRVLYLANAAFSGLAALLGGNSGGYLCRESGRVILPSELFANGFVLLPSHSVVTLRHCYQPLL